MLSMTNNSDERKGDAVNVIRANKQVRWNRTMYKHIDACFMFTWMENAVAFHEDDADMEM